MAAKLIEQFGDKTPFEERGFSISSEQERSSYGLIQYTDLATAIQNYKEDPQSIKKMEFIARAFGCDTEALLKDAGLEPLLQAFQEGRMISSVKSHAMLADAYNNTDVIMAGLLAQEKNIPSAVLAMSYSDDKFIPSPEKSALFGSQRYFVGYNEKGNPQFTAVNIKPSAIRTYQEDGKEIISPIDNIDQAVGIPLKDIMITITDPTDNRGAKAIHQVGDNKEQYIEAALGMTWGQIVSHPALGDERSTGNVSLPGLHKVLFETTITRLRAQGILPDEQTMPVIYCELGDLSKSILQHATYVPETAKTLGFEGDPADILLETLCVSPETIEKVDQLLTNYSDDLNKDVEDSLSIHNGKVSVEERQAIKEKYSDEALQRIQELIMQKKGLYFHEKSGLLAHGEYADPATYYPVFQALLGHDYCTLDGSDVDYYFMQKVHRAQKLHDQHGVPISTIRIPSDEVTARDNNGEIHPFVDVRLHPTGRYFDIKQAQTEISKEFMPFQAQLNDMLVEARTEPKKPLNRDTTDTASSLTTRIKNEHMGALFKKIRQEIQQKKPGDVTQLVRKASASEAKWYSQRVQPADLERITEAVALDEVTAWWVGMLGQLINEDTIDTIEQ